MLRVTICTQFYLYSFIFFIPNRNRYIPFFPLLFSFLYLYPFLFLSFFAAASISFPFMIYDSTLFFFIVPCYFLHDAVCFVLFLVDSFFPCRSIPTTSSGNKKKLFSSPSLSNINFFTSLTFFYWIRYVTFIYIYQYLSAKNHQWGLILFFTFYFFIYTSRERNQQIGSRVCKWKGKGRLFWSFLLPPFFFHPIFLFFLLDVFDPGVSF